MIEYVMDGNPNFITSGKTSLEVFDHQKGS
jgi:hypothetical protein